MTKPLALFYGDSRAADWPSPELAAVRFANRGIPGDDTAGALYRFPQDVAALAPGIIVLQLGVNDLTMAIYAPRRSEIIATCQSNLRRIVSRSVDLGATLVLTMIFPPAADPWAGWSRDHANLADTIDAVNRDLRQLAGEQVILFETEPLLAEQGRVKPAFALDTLHLNRAGYAALNRALGPLLAGIISSQLDR